MIRYRVWSEEVPFDELQSPALMRALDERQIQVIAAVRPRELEDALKWLELRGGRGGLWPQLSDADGRWMNDHNAMKFTRWALRLLDEANEARLLPQTLAIDLEPPFEFIQALSSTGVGAAVLESIRATITHDRSETRWVHARQAATTLLAQLRELKVESLAAIVPTAAIATAAGARWQRRLGTPIDGIGYDRICPMAYSSLLEGYSDGLFDRSDARPLLKRFAAHTIERFGGGASISIGATGEGALGNERSYREPSELAEDATIAREAGIRDIVAFDLGGMLSRGSLEEWLDALVCPLPQVDTRASRLARFTDRALRWI